MDPMLVPRIARDIFVKLGGDSGRFMFERGTALGADETCMILMKKRRQASPKSISVERNAEMLFQQICKFGADLQKEVLELDKQESEQAEYERLLNELKNREKVKQALKAGKETEELVQKRALDVATKQLEAGEALKTIVCDLLKRFIVTNSKKAATIVEKSLQHFITVMIRGISFEQWFRTLRDEVADACSRGSGTGASAARGLVASTAASAPTSAATPARVARVAGVELGGRVSLIRQSIDLAKKAVANVKRGKPMNAADYTLAARFPTIVRQADEQRVEFVRILESPDVNGGIERIKAFFGIDDCGIQSMLDYLVKNKNCSNCAAPFSGGAAGTGGAGTGKRPKGWSFGEGNEPDGKRRELGSTNRGTDARSVDGVSSILLNEKAIVRILMELSKDMNLAIIPVVPRPPLRGLKSATQEAQLAAVQAQAARNAKHAAEDAMAKPLVINADDLNRDVNDAYEKIKRELARPKEAPSATRTARPTERPTVRPKESGSGGGRTDDFVRARAHAIERSEPFFSWEGRMYNTRTGSELAGGGGGGGGSSTVTFTPAKTSNENEKKGNGTNMIYNESRGRKRKTRKSNRKNRVSHRKSRRA